MEKCTIYDIAKLANVSVSTVSRVVNNYPHVKKATRDRVLEAMKANNYVPDENARGLVTHTSKMVGILISDMRTTHHTDAIFHMERDLSRRGYLCVISNTGVEPREMALAMKQLSQRNVDAAILIGSIYQTEEVRESIAQYLPTTPVMMLNGCLDGPNIYGLVADEENGINNCVRLLANKGRKNLAFVVDRYTPSNRLKIQGYRKGMERFCGGAEPIVVKADEETQGAYGATVRLFDDHPEVDGIIYAEDLLAVAGIRAMTDLRLSVPENVSVIGVNNSQYAVNCIPTLTSLDNMLVDMSKRLIRNLVFVMRDREVEHRIMMRTQIEERKST